MIVDDGHHPFFLFLLERGCGRRADDDDRLRGGGDDGVVAEVLLQIEDGLLNVREAVRARLVEPLGIGGPGPDLAREALEIGGDGGLDCLLGAVRVEDRLLGPGVDGAGPLLVDRLPLGLQVADVVERHDIGAVREVDFSHLIDSRGDLCDPIAGGLELQAGFQCGFPPSCLGVAVGPEEEHDLAGHSLGLHEQILGRDAEAAPLASGFAAIKRDDRQVVPGVYVFDHVLFIGSQPHELVAPVIVLGGDLGNAEVARLQEGVADAHGHVGPDLDQFLQQCQEAVGAGDRLIGRRAGWHGGCGHKGRLRYVGLMMAHDYY